MGSNLGWKEKSYSSFSREMSSIFYKNLGFRKKTEEYKGERNMNAIGKYISPHCELLHPKFPWEYALDISSSTSWIEANEIRA